MVLEDIQIGNGLIIKIWKVYQRFLSTSKRQMDSTPYILHFQTKVYNTL